MRALGSILFGLVRPGAAIDRAGSAVRWLWIPLAVLLLASVLVKTMVGTPMQIESSRAQAEAMLEQEMASWPEEERAQYERDMAAAEASGEMTADEALEAAMGVTSVAAVVFGVLGAAVALLYVATFFFVAAKTWANPVGFTSMLTVAGLSLLPHAVRNTLQAVYMSATGIWLQHPGLGALVAPKELTEAPGTAYALLSQIDIFVLWGLALLLGALLSKTIGIERKRALTAVGVFVAVTGVLQAVPTIVSGMFMAAGGM